MWWPFCWIAFSPAAKAYNVWNRTTDTGIFSPLLYRLSYLAILIKPKLLEALNGHSCEAAIKPKVCKGVNHGTDTCAKIPGQSWMPNESIPHT